MNPDDPTPPNFPARLTGVAAQEALAQRIVLKLEERISTETRRWSRVEGVLLMLGMSMSVVALVRNCREEQLPAPTVQSTIESVVVNGRCYAPDASAEAPIAVLNGKELGVVLPGETCSDAIARLTR